jgi:hypothetical protein
VTGNDGAPHFLATHPSNAQRIEELLERLPEVEDAAAPRLLRLAIAMLQS